MSICRVVFAGSANSHSLQQELFLQTACSDLCAELRHSSSELNTKLEFCVLYCAAVGFTGHVFCRTVGQQLKQRRELSLVVIIQELVDSQSVFAKTEKSVFSN